MLASLGQCIQKFRLVMRCALHAAATLDVVLSDVKDWCIDYSLGCIFLVTPRAWCGPRRRPSAPVALFFVRQSRHSLLISRPSRRQVPGDAPTRRLQARLCGSAA